jgi:polysaccharide biosynthesis/export protein
MGIKYKGVNMRTRKRMIFTRIILIFLTAASLLSVSAYSQNIDIKQLESITGLGINQENDNNPASLLSTSEETTDVYDKTINPDEYKLAPGDKLVLNLWGRLEAKYVIVIQPDGNIYIPELGTFNADNKTLTNFRSEVTGRIAITYKDIDHSLLLVSLHRIKIQINGQIAKPGWYTFQGMVRFSEAIQKAGGILINGSYKHVLLSRSNGEKLLLNLRSILNNDPDAFDPYLEPGDVITAPLQTELIEAVGQFFKPGIYEIGPGDRVSDIIGEAGGLTLLADMNKTYVERGKEIIPFNIHDIVYMHENASNIELKPGDKVFIGEIKDTVYVLGDVKLSGPFAYNRNFAVLDYIGQARGPGATAKLNATTILRGVPDNVQHIPVELKSLLKGSKHAESPKILPGDIIIVPSEDKKSYQTYVNMIISLWTVKKIFE